MTGKFEDYNNWLVHIAIVITMLVTIFGGVSIVVEFNILGGAFFVLIVMFAAVFAVAVPLGRCSFTANDNKLIFRVGPIKYEYSYSEIKSAETQTGFTRIRHGMYPHVELVITLTNGETETFCDSKVSTDVLSTPEKHKEFLDNHQFTKLSNYINQRAGKSDSNS